MQSVNIAHNEHALAFSFNNFISLGADRSRSDSESTIGMEETAASNNAEDRVGIQPLLRNGEHEQRAFVIGKNFTATIIVFATEKNMLAADTTIEQSGAYSVGQPHIATSQNGTLRANGERLDNLLIRNSLTTMETTETALSSFIQSGQTRNTADLLTSFFTEDFKFAIDDIHVGHSFDIFADFKDGTSLRGFRKRNYTAFGNYFQKLTYAGTAQTSCRFALP